MDAKSTPSVPPEAGKVNHVSAVYELSAIYATGFVPDTAAEYATRKAKRKKNRTKLKK